MYPERKEMIERLTTVGYNVNTKTSSATLKKRWDNAVEKNLFEISNSAIEASSAGEEFRENVKTKAQYSEKRLRRIKENRRHLKALRARRGW